MMTAFVCFQEVDVVVGSPAVGVTELSVSISGSSSLSEFATSSAMVSSVLLTLLSQFNVTVTNDIYKGLVPDFHIQDLHVRSLRSNCNVII